MIPAERCEVIVYPSMLARKAGVEDMLVMDLETVGVDEIKCPWAGLLDMTEGIDQSGIHVEGDCPMCGQLIRLYDAHQPPPPPSDPPVALKHPEQRNVVVTATQMTDASHRYLLHVIVDDDWEIVSVACDLPDRGGAR
jgi:hypothetical protein